jgi:hypothetical protein
LPSLRWRGDAAATGLGVGSPAIAQWFSGVLQVCSVPAAIVCVCRSRQKIAADRGKEVAATRAGWHFFATNVKDIENMENSSLA